MTGGVCATTAQAPHHNLVPSFPQGRSSIGRVSVSKTEGWGFEALLACHNNEMEAAGYPQAEH